MNPYVQTLYDQIGRAAFFMMNARSIRFDNCKNSLQWQISNSSVAGVCVTYNFSHDLYDVSFLTITKAAISEIVIEHVEVSELHRTIERMTGLSLTIPTIQVKSRTET